ncbi:MAG TPA: hypothetical protein VFQ07_00860, partial [Candidatus Polarisedimenticolia bacterium]|nr:hypothetical protein [Candidatus Polarisedimenticolia bacterium]
DGALIAVGRIPALPAHGPTKGPAAPADGRDAYVSRLSPDGGTVLSTTIFGGSGEEEPAAVAVGADGRIHVTGRTTSADFPSRAALQAGLAGAADAFAFTLSADGASIVRSTWLGGPGRERGLGIAEARDATLWIVGSKDDGSSNEDGFVVALDPGASAPRFMRPLASQGAGQGAGAGRAMAEADQAQAVAVAPDGAILIAGKARSGAGGGWDGFVARLSPVDGSPLSRLDFGGEGDEEVAGVAIAPDGGIAVAGRTTSAQLAAGSESPEFPRGTQAHGAADIFLVRFTADGLAVTGSARLGGSDDDDVSGVAMDAHGRVLITGTTRSADLTTVRPRQKDRRGPSDMYVAVVSGSAARLTSLTYLGGQGEERGGGIAVTQAGDAVVAGATGSADLADVQRLRPDDAIGLGFVAAIPIPAASPIGWANPVSGNWNTPANWNPPQVPGASDDAIITVDGTYTVTVDADVSVASLTLGGTSGTQTLSLPSLSPRTFTLSGPGSVGAHGVIAHAGGTFRGTGTLTVDGAYNWSGGTLNDAGTTTVNGPLAISGNVGKTLTGGRHLETGGTTTWTGTGDIATCLSNQTCVIANTGTWDIQNNQAINLSFGGATTFVNNGTVRKTAGTGITSFLAAMNNASLVDITIAGGTLGLDGGGTSTGAFTGSAGTTLRFGGANTLNAGSSITAPTVSFSSGAVNINGSYNAGTQTTMASAGSTVNINPSATVTSLGTTLAVSNGTLNLSSGEPIGITTLTMSGGVLGGADTVTVSGPSTWSGGTMQGAGTTPPTGTTIFNNALAISGAAKQLQSGRRLETNGTTTWTGTGDIATCTSGHTCVIANTGTWDIQNNQNVTLSLGGTTTFLNTGTVRKTAGTGIFSFQVQMNNDSLVDITVPGGTLGLDNGGTSNGSFTGSAGTTLRFGGTTTCNAGSSIAASTVASTSGGTTNINGSYNASTQTTLSSGTLNLNGAGPFNTGALVMSGGVIGGTGTFTASLASTWSGGTMTGSGTTTFNAGLSMSGSGKNLQAGRRLDTNGTTTWSAGDINTCTSGFTCTINNTGTWDIQSNQTVTLTGGGTTNFVNNGTVRKTAGTGITSFQSPMHNASLVDNTVPGSTLGLDGGGTSTGSFTGSAGTTLRFGGATTLNTGSSIAGATVAFASSGATVNVNGSYNAGVQTTVTNGTVNFNTAGTVISMGSALVMNGGTLNLSSGEPINVTTLTLSGGALGGSDIVTASGASTWSGGAMTGSGATTFNGALAISGGSSRDLTGGRHLETNGATTWTGTGDIRTCGTSSPTCVIVNNGTWDIQTNLSVTLSFGGTASFVNNGTILKSAGTGTTTISAAFSTSSNVQVNTGTLSFASYKQTAGTTWLNGGNLTSTTPLAIQGGTVKGTGTITGGMTSAGHVVPGQSPGLLTVAGNYT